MVSFSMRIAASLVFVFVCMVSFSMHIATSRKREQFAALGQRNDFVFAGTGAFQHRAEKCFQTSPVDKDDIRISQSCQVLRGWLEGMRVGADGHEHGQFDSITADIVDDIANNAGGRQDTQGGAFCHRRDGGEVKRLVCGVLICGMHPFFMLHFLI